MLYTLTYTMLYANYISEKGIIHNDEVIIISGIQGWFNILTSVNVILHIKR